MFEFVTYRGKKVPQLSAISTANLKILESCYQQIIQAAQLYCGAQHDPNIAKNLKVSVEQTNAKAYKQSSNVYCANQQILSRFKWWQKIQSDLLELAHWQRFIRTVPTEKQSTLQNLKYRFDRQALWACYSSKALHHVAFKTVPVIKDYLDYAQQEFLVYRRQLDRQTRMEVLHFLQALQKWLHKTQQSLADAMLVRLHVASQQYDVTYDDCLHHFVTELQQLGALKKNMKLPTPSRNLLASHLSDFQAFIGKGYSKWALLHIKHDVAWCKPHPHYVLCHDHHGIYSIPKTFQTLISPSKFIRFWKKLTGQIDVQKYWLQHQSLIAALHLLQRKSIIDLETHAMPKMIHSLAILQQNLMREWQTLPVRHRLIHWLLGESHITTRLRQYYKAQFLIVVDKSLELLRHQLELWEGQWACNERFEISHSAALRVHQLTDIIRKIQQVMVLTPTQQTKIHDSNRRFAHFYRRIHPAQDHIPKLLDIITKQEIPNGGQCGSLYIHAQHLQSVAPLKFKALQRQAYLARTQVMKRLQQMIDTFIASGSALPEEAFGKIGRAILFIKHIGNHSDRILITSSLAILHRHYLRWATQTNEIPTQRLLDAEGLLLTASMQLGLHELHQLVMQLKQQRITSGLASYRKACVDSLALLDHQQQCEVIMEKLTHYHTILCQWLQQHYQHTTIQRLHALVTEAHSQRHISVKDCQLDAALQSLLAINKTDQPTRYCLNELLWLKKQPALQTLSVIALTALQTSLQHKTARILTFTTPVHTITPLVTENSSLTLAGVST